ncbi:HEAT repeat domain-containing protein [Psychrobacillus sp. FSL H8-0510]|uniref:HEAT repeat domain-containing protein n=1 Tax=Psychrobacillus sp. FSL H8-0510 TaxID=2921394 RepID=UPI0030F6FDB9
MTTNIDALVKQANDKNSWENRLAALKGISEIDCHQRKDVVTRLAIHDKVFAVKEEACRIANKLNITKNGKVIRLGKKDIGYKNSDFTKTFSRIKRESKMEEFDLELFKKKFQIVNPEMYDVMNFEKRNKFDEWVEKLYISLPKK